MRCGRCGEEIQRKEKTVVLSQGNRNLPVHVICKRGPLDVMRMKEDKIVTADRKQWVIT